MMKLKWIGSLLILAGIVGCKTPDRPNLVVFLYSGCRAFRFS